MDTREDVFLEKANGQITKLFELYPIDDLRPSEVNEEMKGGLARLFADKGLKAYIENAVKIAIKNLSTAHTAVEIAYWKGRVETLEQLLTKAKACYNTIEITKKGK